MAGKRRKNVSSEQRKRVLELLEHEPKVQRVAQQVQLSASTVYKIRRENDLSGQNEQRVSQQGTRPMERHREDLIRTLLDLKGISPVDVHDFDLATFYSRPEEPSWPIAKGRVWREPDGGLVVRLSAEAELEWTYSGQHLVGEPVWPVIEEWKIAMASDISCRMALLGAVIDRIKGPRESGGLGIPVVYDFKSVPKGDQVITMYFAFRLFDQVLSRCLGLQHGEIGSFRNMAEYGVELGGNPVILSLDSTQCEEAIDYFQNGQEGLRSLREAQAGAEAFRRAEDWTAAVMREVEMLRLSVGFPLGSVCDGCREWVNLRSSGTV